MSLGVRVAFQLGHVLLGINRAAGFVFSIGEDDPLAAVHMYRVLQRLDDVSNACETAANAFLPIVYN
jgi:uncharacterized protein Yka (UPF0111/DUF47 family)